MQQEHKLMHTRRLFPHPLARLFPRRCVISHIDNLVFTFTVSQKETGRSKWFQHLNNVRTT